MTNGIFTTIKVKSSIPLFFELHKNRLAKHANKINLGSFSLSYSDIQKYLKKNNITDCVLKITVTKKNNKTIVDMQTRTLPQSLPIKLITVPDTRDKNKILKTTHREINMEAMKKAQKNNANDALFVQNNNIVESTIANVFSINKKGQIITPPLENKGLKGITRTIIMQNLDIVEEEIQEDTKRPLVLTNSLRIQKATHLNGKKLQDADELIEKIKDIISKVEIDYQDKKRVARSEGLPKRAVRSNEDEIRTSTAGKRPGQDPFFKQLEIWIDPEKVFLTLFKEEPNSFWLDSSLTNYFSRYSYMGIPSEEIYYSLKANLTTVKNNDTIKQIPQNIFDYLNNQLKINYAQSLKLPFPFTGGFVGYFGYELKALTGSKIRYRSPYPDSLWYKIENFIAFDHQEKNIYLVCAIKNKTKAEEWFNVIANKVKQSHTTNTAASSFDELRTPRNDEKLNFKLDRNHQQYLKDIAKCKEYLKKGESYQICLTNKFTTETKIDPLSLYLKLRKSNPAPYSAFIKIDDLAILCSSPEEFLKIDTQGNVETKPIKGTIKRGENKTADKKLINELTASKKDWSENAMIVDLLRNDLGKVCEFESVKVKKLMKIESYQTVHQLVSTVVGKLQKEKTIIDCVKACFPGGSMTGAPKIKTMEIIDSLEKKARGVYSGTIGFLSFNQNAALNIIIRTIVMQKNNLEIGAGGAILMDSDPEKEYAEMLLKAKALIEATQSELYTKPMHTVFLALGSNVGNKKEQINSAIEILGSQIKNIKLAKFYETKPMYYENQEDFLNTALQGETDLSPEELLIFIKSIEKKLGRQKRFRNGPREIDIDILFYDDLIFKKENLQIPHPRIQEREFVLKPLMDLDPNFIHPMLKKPISKIWTDKK
ncbi:aminodeoxychorismate synthase component I [Candidatus Roizmanbacteria bacterium]|nr:aminodeoxychorismate synthase component I [Candidatus Roizmanbacteria bacterium]